jgi:hypothetical protein
MAGQPTFEQLVTLETRYYVEFTHPEQERERRPCPLTGGLGGSLLKGLTMKSRLSPSEVRVAKVLDNGLDLIEAVRNSHTAGKGKGEKKNQRNNYADVLEALRELAENEGIPIVVVGGVAAIYLGYERYAEDTDIVISAQDFGRIISACCKYGFDIVSYNPTGMHALSYDGFKIKVLGEGKFTGDVSDLTNIPSPAELGVTSGLQFVALEKWVHLKLASGRCQDYADVVEVLKTKNPAEIQAIEGYLMNVSLRYAEKFAQLVKDAEREKAQELGRLKM